MPILPLLFLILYFFYRIWLLCAILRNSIDSDVIHLMLPVYVVKVKPEIRALSNNQFVYNKITFWHPNTI